MVKVSLLVALYNKEKYVERCLKSLLNQNYKNIEIIIVDDGSTDGSLAIITKYLGTRNLKIISISNSGLSHARNVGIQNATGDYIGFIDADDYVECNYVRRLIDENIKNNTKAVFGGLNIYYPDGAIKQNKYEKNCCVKCSVDDIMRKPIKSLNCALFHKSCFECVTFDENIRMYSEDLLMEFKLLFNIREISLVSDCLYNYSFDDPNSITSNRNKETLIERCFSNVYCGNEISSILSTADKKYSIKNIKQTYGTYCAYVSLFLEHKIEFKGNTRKKILHLFNKNKSVLPFYLKLFIYVSSISNVFSAIIYKWH